MSNTIIAGSEYSISLWVSAITLPSNSFLGDGWIRVGVSNEDDDLGTFVVQTNASQVDEGYVQLEATFIAPFDATYLTIRPFHGFVGISECYVVVDNVQLINLNPPALEINTSVLSNVTCENGSDGSAMVEITSGTLPYEILWSTGEATETISNLSAGTYSVSVNDAAGMVSIAEIEIEDGRIITVESLTVDDATCFDYMDGAASVISDGGIEPIMYQWSNGTDGDAIMNVISGIYTVTVTDIDGCSAQLEIMIDQPEQLTAMATIVHPSCEEGSTGSIQISSNGGTPGYSYLWEDASEEDFRESLAPGAYSTTITDENFCGLIIESIVNEPNSIDLSQTEVIHPVCAGDSTGSIELVPSGGTPEYDYDWSTGDDTPIISALLAGTYEVTVTDSEGCFEVATYIITDNTVLEIVISSTSESNPGANDGSAMVEINTGDGPFDFSWSTGDTTAIISDLSAGTYTVTVTDVNGCSKVASVGVTSGECTMNANVEYEPTSCYNTQDGVATITLTEAIDPISYLWSDGSTEGNRTDLSAGNYGVTIFDAAGCSDTINDIMITSPEGFSVSINIVSASACGNGSNGALEAEVSGDATEYNYLWSNGETTTFADSLAAGDYNITVVDSNGCTASAEASISSDDYEAPTILVDDLIVYAHQDGFDSVMAADFDSGSTDNCGIVMLNYVTSPTVSCESLGAQTLLIYASDESSNLSDTVEVTLTLMDTIPPMIVEPVDGIVVESCEPIDFELPLFIDNCSDSLTIIQTAGIASGEVFPIGVTELAFEVSDISGNSIEYSFTIEVISDLELDVSTNDVFCFGDSTGMIEIQVSGSHEPYLQDSSLIQNGLPSGMYTVVVMDTVGCFALETVSIEEPSELVASFSASSASGSDVPDGELTITVEGGTQPYSIDLFNEDGILIEESETGVFNDLLPAIYNVVVIDANDCEIALDDLEIDFTVSTKNLFEVNNILVYPNPVIDVLKIEVTSIESEIGICLKSANGKKVIQKSIQKNGLYFIDTNEFASGIYFLTLTDDTNIATKRISIIR